MVLSEVAVFFFSLVSRPCMRKTKLRFSPFHPRQATGRVKVITHFHHVLKLRKSGFISTPPPICVMSCAGTNIDSKIISNNIWTRVTATNRVSTFKIV